MSERGTSNLSYSIGYRLGQFVRVYLIVFGVSVAGVVIGSTVLPERVETIVVWVSGLSGLIAAVLSAIAMKHPGMFCIGAYMMLVMLGSFLQDREPRPTRALVGIAIGTILMSFGFVGFTLRSGRKNKELERMLFSESTSIAFFVTMFGAISYALLEAWIDAPKLSMWIVWTVGMGSWVVLGAVLRRRYS